MAAMAAMARLLPLFCLAALAIGGIPANSMTNKRPPASEAAILQTERLWDEANLHHDVAALKHLLAPQFVQITEEGHVISREVALRELSSKPPTGAAYRISHSSVIVSRPYATVNATYTEVGRGTHGWYRVVLRIADVYAFDRRWRGLVGYAHVVSLTHCPSACQL